MDTAHEKSEIGKFFCFVHDMMIASVPLLEFAADRCDGELRRYYRQHIKEESGHVEILERDLERMGVALGHPAIEAAEIVGVQYYLIAHSHPAALLGYMAALERDVVPGAEIGRLESICGTELRCLRLHSKLDVDHILDLDEQISKFDGELKLLIENNEGYTRARVNDYGRSLR